MKKFLFILSVISFSVFLFNSCKKEYSYENGISLGGYANTSLLDSSGNCQTINVKGKYYMDTVLTDSNYLSVTINTKTPGKYKVYSDTNNGFWFIDSGYLISSGSSVIKVKGYGKPILPKATSFVLTLDSTYCTFTVALNNNAVVTDNTDYFPNSIASYWTYANSYLSDTVRYTVSKYIGVYTNGNSYSIFTPSDSTNYSNDYYRKDGSGNYYQLAALDDSVTSYTDYTFLKDYAAVGSTWDSPEAATTFLGKSTTIKYTMTIAARNISYTVNGVPYANVIQVRTDIKYKVNGTYQTVDTFNDYYAKGIGWIDEEDASYTPTFSFTLKKYQVN
jgi:hypothetical protein